MWSRLIDAVAFRDVGRGQLGALLGLAAAAVIALADYLSGDEAILVEALALPPFLTAILAPPRATAAVGACCLALAVGLAWVDDGMAAGGDAVRAATVLAGAGLAFAVSTVRAVLLEARSRDLVLTQANELLEHTLDEERTAERSARLLLQDFGDLATIDMLDAEGEIRNVVVAARDPQLEREVVELRRSPIARTSDQPVAIAIHAGRPSLITRARDVFLRQLVSDPRRVANIRRLYPRSAICVPLEARGERLGALSIVSRSRGRRYGEKDLRVVEHLASRAAVALVNARMHGGQVRIAETLQRGLRPPKPGRVPGLEVGTRFSPAIGLLGGDFYDVFQRGEASWAAVIGDVCGKGPESAVLTALARYTIRAETEHLERPHEVLERLNGILFEEQGDFRYTSACLAFFDLGAMPMRVTLCRAGHPPPLVLRHGGDYEAVESSGTLLGVSESPRLEDATVDLDPGDAVVLYTDGVTDQGLGEEGLRSMLADAAGRPAAEVAAMVEDAARAAAERRHHDDMAVLVIRMNDGRLRPGPGKRTAAVAGSEAPVQ